MGNYVTIRPAVPGEEAQLASMWMEASDWLKRQGIDQWQYPPNMATIHRDVATGTAYLVRKNGETVGTITINEYADPEFWNSGDSPDNALYGHRMIVRQHARGQRIGNSLIDWACRKTSAADREWLRLDAWKTNQRLAQYYRELGFSHLRTVDLPHRRSGALFQRGAGTSCGCGPAVISLELPVRDVHGHPMAEGTAGWSSEC